MTTKTQRLIEPADIQGLQLECKHCGSTLGMLLSKGAVRVPTDCPNCGETWFYPDERPRRVLVEFIEAYKRLLRELPERVSLRFEIAPDTDAKTQD